MKSFSVYLHFSLFTIFEFTATFFVINLSKYGGSAFNWAHDIADFPIGIVHCASSVLSGIIEISDAHAL